MRIFRIFILMIPLVFMTGCSWLYGENGLVQDNEYSYLNSEMGSDLKIPEGLNAIQIVDEFPIPDVAVEAQNYADGEQLDYIAPTIILAVDSRSGVYNRDENFAPTVWFRIKQIRIWQALIDYLSDNNIPLLKKDIEQGTIETDWLEKDQSSFYADIFGSDEARALRTKYRFTLSKSPKGNLQLLSVQNIANQQLGYDDSGWKDESTSRKQAILFMNDFLGSWAEQREFEARKRVLEANKGIALEIGKDNNENLSFIASADFQQTWVKLATVLPQIGLEIDDKDQTLGIYFVQYNGADSVGFFESLKFWQSSKDRSLPIKEEDYRINLSAMGGKTAITLATKEGSILSAETLNDLYPYFSEHFSLNAETERLKKESRNEGSAKRKSEGRHKKHE